MEIETLVKRNPETMRIEERTAVGSPKGYEPGDPGSNYSSTAKVVTVELGGLSGGRGGGGGGGGGGSERARVLMNFGEHARELISSEIALGLLRMLESEQKIQQAAGGGAVGRQTLDALKHTTLVILPMENVSGRRLLEQEGENCLRKTGRIVPGGLGVDPNRNWGVDWGVKEKDYNFNEEYGGSEPFSEPEARIIKKLVEDLNVHAWVNVHSGMAAMFLPIDYQAQVPEDVGMLHNSRIIGSLKAKYCPLCEIGSGGATVGYKAHGTIVDYLWEEAKVPFPMTWEVMGDTEAAFYDCVRMFNPLTKAEYNDVVHRWSAATLEMVRLLPMNPNIPKYDSFVAPTMSELPVPDMKGFTAWHKEQIEKLKDEPSSPAKPDGTTGGGQAGDAGRREEGGGGEQEDGEQSGGGEERVAEEEHGGEEEEHGGQEEEQMEEGQHEGGGHGEDRHDEEEEAALAAAEAEDLEDFRGNGEERGERQQGSSQGSHTGHGTGANSRPQERGSVYQNRPIYRGGQEVSSNPLHLQFLLFGCLFGLLFFGLQLRKRYRAKVRSRRAIRSFSGRQIGLPI